MPGWVEKVKGLGKKNSAKLTDTDNSVVITGGIEGWGE